VKGVRFTDEGPAAGEAHVAWIDGSEISDRDGLMDALGEALALPDWFGRNWDALRDVLRDPALRNDVTTLVIRNSTSLWRESPRIAGSLVEIWLDAELRLVFEW
jgi:RNAse (barnase) inhibitor barstar